MRRFIDLLFVLTIPTLTFGHKAPASDPQGLSYAAHSIAVLTGGNAISDVTLTGTVTWNNSGGDTRTATLRALGTGESRIYTLPFESKATPTGPLSPEVIDFAAVVRS